MYLLELWFFTIPSLPPAQDFSVWIVSSCKPLCTDVSLGPAALRMLGSLVDMPICHL